MVFEGGAEVGEDTNLQRCSGWEKTDWKGISVPFNTNYEGIWVVWALSTLIASAKIIEVIYLV